ncbi:dihydrodipicolinate synthase family protein, partial [Mycobacterium sp. ITM-2017-0098]
MLATPFDESLDLDLKSLRTEVASFGDDGCSGLVALGVFGEAASLQPAEAAAVTKTVAESTDLPYVLGLSERSPEAVVAQALRLLGAVPRPPAALMAQIADANPAVTADSLRRLHEETGVGVLIQDYPVASGVSVTDVQVAELVRSCSFAVGVKSESPPTSVAIAHLAPRLDVPVFGGLGGVGLLDELAAGSAGAMTGFSHPAVLASVLRAYDGGGFVAAR